VRSKFYYIGMCYFNIKKYNPLIYYWILILIAFIMRIWDLSSRAVHHDESLHAFYSWQLAQGNGYEHNPMLHGPFQFEMNALIFTVFGSSDFSSRILYVIFGSLLIGLPYFFRFKIGNYGAFFTSLILCFSPTMLYFSRFARNDILVVFWTFSIVILIWKYIENQKNHYMYMISGLLALSFCTKENTYIFVVTIMATLFLMLLPKFKTNIIRNLNIYNLSPPLALYKLFIRILYFIFGKFNLRLPKPQLNLLILIFLLALPQWSALFAILQDSILMNWTNLTIAQRSGASAGIPIAGGVVLATLIVISLIIISIYFGYKWNWNVWWKSSSIFYGIWIMSYTKFFTDFSGVGSGIWQSLGYWVVQQEVARGGQPWYYYFFTMSIYEFFIIFCSIFAIIFYFKKRTEFTSFLISWSFITLLAYITASEKMPWLIVHISLPLICLTGYVLGDHINSLKCISFRKNLYKNKILSKLRYFRVYCFTVLIVFMFGFTVFVGFRTTYIQPDEPLGPIVYTQTSSDIRNIRNNILDLSIQSGDLKNIPILIDQTSGYTWPWSWYLREYKNVNYINNFSNFESVSLNRKIIIIHEGNLDKVSEILDNNYRKPLKIRHRSWFPEEIYRNFEIKDAIKSIFWKKIFIYMVFNKGIDSKIGSENSYVFYNNNLPLN